MTGMGKRSEWDACFGLLLSGEVLTFVGRAEFIKGDPYIRDMKNTA